MSTNVMFESPALSGPAGSEGGRRRTMMMIAAAALALAGVAAAGAAWYAGWFGGSAHEQPVAAASDAPTAAYIDVPAMAVNLHSSDGRARFLKVHFMLVASDPGHSEAIKAKLPLYLDALQPFLRELRPEDLNGSPAVFRIKEEMMVRANDSLGAGTIRDILIQDLVQQ